MKVRITSAFPFARSKPVLLAALATCAMMGSTAQAGLYTYAGGSTADINVATNWTPNGVPSSAGGDTAKFDGTSATGVVTLSNGGSVTTASGTGITLAISSAADLTLDPTNTLFRFANGTAISVAAGSGAFSFGNNSGSAISQTLGSGSGQTHTFTNDASKTATIGSDIVFGGGGNGTHTMVFNGSGNWVANNQIRNTGTITETNGLFHITKSGSGTLTLAHNSNSYSGATTINAGTVKVSANNALGLGGQYTLNRAIGATTVNGATAAATLDLAGSTTVNEVILLNGGANGASLINSNVNTAATVGNGVAGVTFSNAGNDLANIAFDAVSVRFTGGEGTGAAATVRKGSFGATGIAVIWMGNAGSGYTSAPTVTIVNNTNNTASNAVATAVMTSVTLTGTNNYVGGDGALTIAAPIGETAPGAGLIKIGNGVTTLSGKNTFTGPTRVSAGKLALSGSLDPTTLVSVDSGAYLQFSSDTAVTEGNALSLTDPASGTIILNSDVVVGSFIINGVAQPGGVYSASSAPSGYAGDLSIFTGAGTLTVVPEPTVGLLAVGSVSMLLRRRRA